MNRRFAWWSHFTTETRMLCQNSCYSDFSSLLERKKIVAICLIWFIRPMARLRHHVPFNTLLEIQPSLIFPYTYCSRASWGQADAIKLVVWNSCMVTHSNTLSGPKDFRGSRGASLKSRLVLSGAFSLIFVTTLKHVPIFLRNGKALFILEPALRLL